MISPYLLSVQNAGKHFDNKVVLERISLNIQAGEIVALVGPSGSGKSTLMNTIMRSVELSDGAVLLDNKNIRDYRDNKEYAQKVGMLHQQYDLVKQLEVIHNVLAGRLNLGIMAISAVVVKTARAPSCRTSPCRRRLVG